MGKLKDKSLMWKSTTDVPDKRGQFLKGEQNCWEVVLTEKFQSQQDVFKTVLPLHLITKHENQIPSKLEKKKFPEEK